VTLLERSRSKSNKPLAWFHWHTTDGVWKVRVPHSPAHVQSKITSKNSQKNVQKHFSNEMKIHFFIEDTHLPPKISKFQWNENTFLHWRHAFTPKDFQMHQQSLDHSYCKRETSLMNSKSVMILVVRLAQLTETNKFDCHE
jgi:hypothetical protein